MSDEVNAEEVNDKPKRKVKKTKVVLDKEWIELPDCKAIKGSKELQDALHRICKAIKQLRGE